MRTDDLMGEVGGVETRTSKLLRLVAVHEAGHAVATCILHPESLQAVSIRSTSRGDGFVSAAGFDSGFGLAEIEQTLQILLAGRAAEQVVFGVPSAGAGGDGNSDLARATGLAATAVGSLGLTAGNGLLWLGSPATLSRLGTLGAPAVLDDVRRMIETAYARAISLVQDQRAAIDAVVDALLQHRELSGEAVTEIVLAKAPGCLPTSPP